MKGRLRQISKTTDWKELLALKELAQLPSKIENGIKFK